MVPINMRDVVKVVGGTLLSGADSVDSSPSAVVTSICLDSRKVEPGALFIPIKGEKYDPHEFIGEVMAAGAVASLTERRDVVGRDGSQVEGKVYILVEDALRALQALAAYYRGLFGVSVIGVTGSVGKTTTKEMLAAALGGGRRLLKTKGNLNSQIGVAQMMFEIEEEHELAVIEMGVSEKGEMERLAWMAKPEAAVITNVGVSHIGNFGSRDNIRTEKCHIMDYFPDGGGFLAVCGGEEGRGDASIFRDENGEGVFNDETPVFRWDLAEGTRKRLADATVVTYGLEGDYDYVAEDVEYRDGKTTFTVRVREREEEVEFDADGAHFRKWRLKPQTGYGVELGVVGRHYVYNALAAFALADRYGIPYQEVVGGLKGYRPEKMRGQVLEKAGVRILDDSYNASPDSMKSGLEVLLAMDCEGRRFAVFADVLELGEHSEECHREVGRHMAKLYGEGIRVDGLVTVGREARLIAEEAEVVYGSPRVRSFEGKEEAVAYLKEEMRPGDLALVKGSRGMKMDQLVQGIVG